VKHNYTLNYIYQLPYAGGPGLARAVLGGWQMSGILNLRSGLANTVSVAFNRSRNQHNATGGFGERPNLKPDGDPNPVLGGPDQYADVSPSSCTRPASTAISAGTRSPVRASRSSTCRW
jgi:hypothetical protein